MDSKIIGLVVDDTLNVDILAWTLYYLTGQSHYYYYGFGYWFTIEDDPLNRILQTDRCIVEVEYDGSSVIEEFTEQLSSLKAENDYPGVKLILTRLSYENKLNTEVVDLMKKECDKVIVISSFGESTLYSNKLNKELEFMVDDFMETYFADSKAGWEDVSNSPWDRREYIALNFRPFVALNPELAYDLSTLNHTKLTYSDVYENLDTKIRDIFSFIGYDIDESKFENWENIYDEWRRSVKDIVSWNRDFKKIVKDIVDGEDTDLTIYNLDILRESAILHELLYKHNLNIKSYGLEELPKNTKEIHELLEPNFHPLNRVNVY